MTQEQRERERLLLEGAESLTEAVSGTVSGHWMWCSGDDHIWVSNRLRRQLGCSGGHAEPPNLHGWLELVAEADRALLIDAVERLLRAKNIGAQEIRLRCCDGVLRWFRLCARSTRYGPSNLKFVSGTLEEIHKIRHLEEQRDAERAHLAAILDTAVDAILTIDDRGVIETANPATERLFGYSQSELIGENIRMLMPAEQNQEHDEHLRRYRKTGIRHIIGSGQEANGRRRDGSLFPIELSVSEFVTHGNRHFAGIIRDITSRVEIEESLRAAVAQEELSRETTERQAEELREAAEELAEARDVALESTRAKSQFLATMSHEIRTPMNGIVGIADLLSRTPLTAEQQDYVRTIRSSSDALLGIINDILDYSKIEANKLSIENVEFDLWDAAESVTAVLAEKALTAGLELNVKIGPGVPRRATGDPGRIRQVIMNLVGNALKFTKHGHVQLDLSVSAQTADQQLIRFAVTDTGIGVAPDKVADLFEPFTQADSTTTRRYGGTGLGLAICRRLVEHMGGRLELETVFGSGSTFHFTLPLPSADSQPPRLLPSEVPPILICIPSRRRAGILTSYLTEFGVRVENAPSLPALREKLLCPGAPQAVVVEVDLQSPDVERGVQSLLEPCRNAGHSLLVLRPVGWSVPEGWNCSDLTLPIRKQALYDALRRFGAEPTASPETAKQTPEAASVLSRRILVADDSPVNRLAASKMLEHLGCEVVLAEDGHQAVKSAARGGLDLVLMDCHMPSMDGFTATAEIRKQSSPARLPILALTASVLDEDRQRCMAADMDGILAKPITLSQLASAIRQWCPESEAPPIHNGDPPALQP